jgi:hypothetical protein
MFLLACRRHGDTKALAVPAVEAPAAAITGAGLATADQVAAAITDLTALAADPGPVLGGLRIPAALGPAC